MTDKQLLINYRVAGLRFRLSLYADDPLLGSLGSYAPFICTADAESPFLFSLKVSRGALPFPEERELIGRFRDDTAVIEIARSDDDGYFFRIGPPRGKSCCVMYTNTGFTNAYVYLDGDPAKRFYGLDSSIMILYAFTSSLYNALLMHASVVEYDGCAYLFLGKSGTGKSTHSRLWLEHISGSELLNDDNPVVRVCNDGTVRVYGTPWSGKTPCYRNRSVPAGAFVRLLQTPSNDIARNGIARGFVSLMPSCSSASWDRTLCDAMHNTLAYVLEHVATYTLGCRPDREAAVLCRNAVIADTIKWM